MGKLDGFDVDELSAATTKDPARCLRTRTATLSSSSGGTAKGHLPHIIATSSAFNRRFFWEMPKVPVHFNILNNIPSKCSGKPATHTHFAIGREMNNTSRTKRRRWRQCKCQKAQSHQSGAAIVQPPWVTAWFCLISVLSAGTFLRLCLLQFIAFIDLNLRAVYTCINAEDAMNTHNHY